MVAIDRCFACLVAYALGKSVRDTLTTCSCKIEPAGVSKKKKAREPFTASGGFGEHVGGSACSLGVDILGRSA